ncbi:MAG: hypothetical protein DWQ05_13775 [Calditrichaeota bacterium]|nr:MAG: hypothetical protein DWQ05_13775 [Calditrichota bacterium]
MEILVAILLFIVKAADKIHLLDHLKTLGGETASAAYEKVVQDKFIEKTFLSKLFSPEFDAVFERALSGLAPKNSSVKKRFVLAILTDPEMTKTLTSLREGELPKKQILLPVFEKVLPNENPNEAVTRFLNNLKDGISTDSKKSLRILLNVPEKVDESLKLTREILSILQAAPRDDYKPAFKIHLAKLPTTGPDLFGREAELEMLDDAWADAHTNIVSLVAWGGVGKSALVNGWLNGLERDNYRGAERVYGWSFYSQGTKEETQVSADDFFNDTLVWFGYDGPVIPSAWDKGKKLAELVRAQRCLLILDGLEPMQYPPGEMQGYLKDQGLQALLKDLARNNPGLCVISTRIKVQDLDSTEGSHVENLENLTPDAGALLLKKLGVKGTQKELTTAANDFAGHALALNLLGSYLAIVHDGEIRKRDLIPNLTEEEKKGGHARRVMESYETWFQNNSSLTIETKSFLFLKRTYKISPELNILYLMGLFDRPAAAGAINALRAEPAIAGLTDALQNLSDIQWKYAIKHLRDLRLLAAEDDRPDTLDCHPLVREHFGGKLKDTNESAWREAHSRLYAYYKNLPEKELPETLAEMEPLFAAVAHGCLAGKLQEALDDVYSARIRRRKETFLTAKLGAFGADLAALSNFFDTPWKHPAEDLSDNWKALVLNWAGFRLRALGRLREAAEPMQAGLELHIEQENWKECALDAGNLSELFLTIGEVSQAVDYARQSVDFADRSGDVIEHLQDLSTLADALHQSGELDEAEKFFREAETMQQERQPEYKYLYSLRGFLFCDLLLSRGQAREVVERAEFGLKVARESGFSLLTFALCDLSLGRGHLLLAVQNIPLYPPSKGDLHDSPFEGGQGDVNTSELAKAATHLNQAVAGLRESGNQDDLPRGLFARATLRRVQGNFPAAWQDLHEAQEIAERGEMGIHMADFHLEACRLNLAEGNPPEARDHLKTAEKMVHAMGYLRRVPEIETLQKQFGVTGTA